MTEHPAAADALRNAVREKIREGASARSVWSLINSYVPSGRITRLEAGRPRLPVELVPYGQRDEFLEALARLSAAAGR